MNSMQTKSSPVRLASTEDGIHLVGSILWLDSQHTGDLSFVSSPTATMGRLHETRVIATEQTLKILEALRKKTRNALVCQYNQPFAIGHLNLELLPSGAGLGGASLWVATGKRTVLYAPHIQPEPSRICRPMQLRRSDTLVLAAKIPFPSSQSPSREEEMLRLIQACRKNLQKHRFPIIVCEPSIMAQEITQRLLAAGLPVGVHQNLVRIHRLYEQYGCELGAYQALSNRDLQNPEKILIFPRSRIKQLLAPKKQPQQGPVFVVDDAPAAVAASSPIFVSPEDRFLLPVYADGRLLEDAISQVKPSQLFIFGPYAKVYKEHLKGCARQVETLFPNHLPAMF